MAGTSYQLTIQVGPNPGKTFPLDKPEMVIGRDLGVDIVINDVEVSRKHAHLVAQQGGYLIEDLGSTNGTVVNGLRLTSPYLLHPGELIALGDHVTLVYDAVQVDPEATAISAGAASARAPATLVETPPFQFPPEQMPPPPFSYSGQVPAGPVQVQPEPVKKRFPTWAIILIVAILLVICVCGVSFKIIDDNNLWCKLFPFLSGCP
jgi:predicted component of type VI protein secretion system